jgi:hypothetical protein
VLVRISWLAVSWVVDAIIQLHWFQVEWIYPLQATHVVAVLIWKRATLMMSVDAAVGAEIMLGYIRVELVELQRFLALNNRDTRQYD